MPAITVIKPRRGTAAQWASTNPVLSAGEEGIETDTGLGKLGDGTTAWNSMPYRNPVAPGTFASPLGNPTIFLGDSITINTADAAGESRAWNAWPSWASLLSDSQITFMRNAGVAGNKSADVLARIQTDVIAYAPKCCMIHVGTNDAYIGSVPVATYAANIKAIVAALVAARITPILTTVMQRSDVASSLVESYNAWLAVYARAAGIKLVDFHGAVLDPTTGLTKSIYTIDGLHPNGAGAQVLGQAMATAMASVLPLWTPPLAQHQASHSANLVPNALFLNNSGGLATGWANDQGALTPTIVAGSGAVLGNWQVVVVNPNNAQGVVHSPVVAAGSGTYGVGDRLAFCGWFQGTSGDGAGASIEVIFFNSGRSVIPVYNFPGTVPAHMFYVECVVGSGDATGFEIYLIVPVGTGGNDTARTAQVTVLNLSKLPAVP